MPPKVARLPRKSVAPSPLELMPPGKPVGLTTMTERPSRFAAIAAVIAADESP